MSLADFVKVADELYTILDSKSTDQVDSVIVNAVVQQLREAISRSAEGPAAYVCLRQKIPGEEKRARRRVGWKMGRRNSPIQLIMEFREHC